MFRKATALGFTLLLAATNILAQSSTPGAPATTPAASEAKDKKKDGPPDPGIRKLSRRERKDRIAKLPEKYREWLQDVQPIIQPTETDSFLVLETDAQRDVFIDDFWKRRDRAQGTSNLAYKDVYYTRLEEAKAEYKFASSDRSRIYLIHGEPTSVLKVECTRYLVPLEIWTFFYIPGMGHDIRFVFYQGRSRNDYILWKPMGDATIDLAELISNEIMAGKTPQEAVAFVFFSSANPGGMRFMSKIEWECPNGDQILRAINQMQSDRNRYLEVFQPPKIEAQEDVAKLLRSAVIPTPGATKLDADFAIKFPGKQGSRTDAQMTLHVPRAQLTKKEVGGVTVYSLDVTGEVLRDGQMYENYRYRFDYPGDFSDEKLPVIIDRFVRPGDYKARIKITDAHSSAEVIVEKDITVPEIFPTPEEEKQKAAGTATVAQLKDDITSGETRLRIIPLAEELLSGIQKIETMVVGNNVKGVEFYLNGKKIAIKRTPPYTLDLDFGIVPMVHKIKAVAIDEKGQPITGDDIVVNTGNDPFRVRIVQPRVAPSVKGPTRVEMSVKIPEGKKLGELQLFLNETKIATLYDEPFVQTVRIPDTQGVGYLRAVATLKDDDTPPVEDVVMINTPAYMEQVDVHLIELPTTVIANGRPLVDLKETSFKVLDEGKPVKITKFEYVKNLPLSIGMAIDTSGSMMPRMTEAVKAAADFFQNVMKSGDKAFLVGFDSQPSLIQKWSPRIADVHASLAKLRAEDYTALFDAVVYSLYNFLGTKGQKALILVSDGQDTASKFTFDQALEYARRTGVPIYTIGIGIRSTDIDVRYKLSRFSSETGGAVYYIERTEDLRKVYTQIQNELRSQYVLGFYPPEGVKSGSKWREVTVQVGEGKAKTIKGYYP